MNNFLDVCEQIYTRNPVMCLHGNEVRDELRRMRGRTNDRRACKQTIRHIADKAGVPFGTVGKAESDPVGCSLATISRIAAAHKKRVAIVFYDEVV